MEVPPDVPEVPELPELPELPDLLDLPELPAPMELVPPVFGLSALEPAP